MKTLHLGLEPKSFHYPVIKTVPLHPKIPFEIWPQITHILVTSKETVRYFPGPWDKSVIAIGPATARALKEKGIDAILAPAATQEGMIALLETMNGYFFYPHSTKARPLLKNYLTEKKIDHFSLPLYETQFQKLEPVPNLEEFDEIVFTSPSTVEGFLRIYKRLPLNKKLTAIGPITKDALLKMGADRAAVVDRQEEEKQVPSIFPS